MSQAYFDFNQIKSPNDFQAFFHVFGFMSVKGVEYISISIYFQTNHLIKIKICANCHFQGTYGFQGLSS